MKKFKPHLNWKNVSDNNTKDFFLKPSKFQNSCDTYF